MLLQLCRPLGSEVAHVALERVLGFLGGELGDAVQRHFEQVVCLLQPMRNLLDCLLETERETIPVFTPACHTRVSFQEWNEA